MRIKITSLLALLFFLPLLSSAQSAPGDFEINCQICNGPNNDKLTCYNKTTAPSVDFTWTPSPGANRYEVYYKNFSIGSWTGPVATITNLNNLRYSASVPLNSQNHYYIKAINNAGFKSCSINFPGAGSCKNSNQNYDSIDEGIEANCYIGSIPPPPPPPPPPPGIDRTPPQILNVRTINITQTSATVLWDTDEPADGQLELCKTYYRCGENTPLLPGLISAHRVDLSGLTPYTTYYYWVNSRDGAGNLRILGYFIFRTAREDDPLYPPPPPPNGGEPVISNVQITAVTPFSATVTWDTDRPADTQLGFCYLFFFCQLSQFDSNPITPHVVNLSSLRPNKKYYFQVGSQDNEGSLGRSTIFSFKTPRSLEILNVQAGNITQTVATITWDTTYPATSKVQFCRFIVFCYGTTSEISDFVTYHVVNISGLKPNTKYYYYAVSKSAVGESGSSSFQSFKTD